MTAAATASHREGSGVLAFLKRRRRAIALAPAWVILVVIAASTLYPLVFVVFTALKSPSDFAVDPLGVPRHPTLGAFRAVIGQGLLGSYAVNSVIITTVSVALVVLVSMCAGFALSFMRFKLRRATLLGIAGLMIQPAALLMIPVVVIVGDFGLIDSYTGIILVYGALGAPFGTYMMYTYMRSVPREIFEAARVDGASMLQTLLRIVAPVLRPAIGALVALDFISFWNEFLFALLLLQDSNKRTMIVGLATLQGQQVLNVPLVSAGMALSILPPLLVFILLHRRLFAGLTAGAIR